MASQTQLILETLVKGSEKSIAQIDSFQRQLDRTSKTASLLGNVLKAAFAGFTVGAAVKSFMSFEDQLAGVSKTTGLQNEALKDLGDELLKYSSKTRTSITNLLTISQIGGQLGIAGDDIGDFTKAIDKLNVALGDEFSGGVEQVTKQVSGLRLIFKDMQTDSLSTDLLNIGNALNVLGASGSATGEVMAEFSDRMGGVLAPLGATAGEVLGLSATLQELQVAPERGSAAVTRAIQAMGKDLKTFADVAGVDVKRFADLYNNDVMGAFALVATQVKAGSANNTEFIQTLDTLGLDGVYTAEVISKLGANTELWAKRTVQATDSLKEQDSVMSEFDKMNSTSAAAVDKLLNALTNLGINIVGVFAEPMTKAINFLTEAIQGMIGWGEDIKKFFDEWEQKSSLTKAAVIALGGALAGAATAGVVSFTAALWKMVPAAIAAMAPLLPWIIGGALVALFVAGIIWLWNNWDKVLGWMSDAAGKAVGWINSKFEAMNNWINEKVDAVKNFITEKWNAIVSFFQQLPGRILNFISQLVTGIIEWFAQLPGKIWEGLNDGLTKITDWVGNIGTTIKNGITDIAGQAWQWGKNLVSNFIDGLWSLPGKAAEAAMSIATEVEDYIGHHSPTRKGPGKDSDKWGANLVNDFVSKLQSGKELVAASMEVLTNPIQSGINIMKKVFSSGTSTIVKQTTNALSAMSSDVQQILDPLFSSINERYQDFYNRSLGFSDKMKKPFESMYNAFRDVSDKINEELINLNTEFDNNLRDINASIGETSGAIEKLMKAHIADLGSQRMDLAKEVLKQGDKIEELRGSLVDKQAAFNAEEEESNKSKLQAEIDDLMSKIRLETNALEDFKRSNIDIDDEITELKRRNRQSDFTNFLEDWAIKKNQRQQEYQDERKLLEDKLDLLYQQQVEVMAVYNDSQKKIRKMQDAANSVYERAINQQVLATEAGTNLMKQYFDSVSDSVDGLAARIKNVKDMTINDNFLSKRVSRYDETNPDPAYQKMWNYGMNEPMYIPPVVDPPSYDQNIYLQIDTMVGKEEFAFEMGNMIARKLGLNNSL